MHLQTRIKLGEPFKREVKGEEGGEGCGKSKTLCCSGFKVEGFDISLLKETFHKQNTLQ